MPLDDEAGSGVLALHFVLAFATAPLADGLPWRLT